MARTTPSSRNIKSSDYSHSPAHYAVVLGDHKSLKKLISSLPKLSDPSEIVTESDSLAQDKLADKISSVLDRRDVPHRETPLHLAVRLHDAVAACTLAIAGADISLQNAAGWSALHEATCQRNSDIVVTLLQINHRSTWEKWRRKLPRVIAVLRRMRDFYMEISFHFESSIVPFIDRIAPSDTYKIWKHDSNLRADTSLCGFDGLKILRSDQTFLFLGEKPDNCDLVRDVDVDVPAGSLLVLNHDDRKVFNAFENAGDPLTESDIAGFWSQTSVYRPGIDVTRAEIVRRSNWRGKDVTESVGEWKSKVYEIHNVQLSFRSRKVNEDDDDADVDVEIEEISTLELNEDDDGFLVADIAPPKLGYHDRRRHSSFVREESEFGLSSKSRRSCDVGVASRQPLVMIEKRRRAAVAAPLPVKEKEYSKSVRPSVWLTEHFPLKTEELLPLLDILASKVKAVRRLRELLTTKFPPGTFPVKVAIPVVPTVKVVITFTKFVHLQPVEQFFTPLSSPRHFLQAGQEEEEEQQRREQSDGNLSFFSLSSSFSSSSSSRLTSKQHQRSPTPHQTDPFKIPSEYTWKKSVDDKTVKVKKSKSTRKTKY
ncbi:hypothetical protein GIB67_026991 [Kingdonia uniflora]|uniref:Ankyrin repeat domain-containing protein n=1 Tax=Kingdonia uniflora TaxID=39325 RepID=A0A7J7P1H3_9MAGN|nr:hypothetical protein GIB67_026991 [Kingdonia uniflora]